MVGQRGKLTCDVVYRALAIRTGFGVVTLLWLGGQVNAHINQLLDQAALGVGMGLPEIKAVSRKG